MHWAKTHLRVTALPIAVLLFSFFFFFVFHLFALSDRSEATRDPGGKGHEDWKRFAISNTTVLAMIQPRRSSSPRLTARIHILPDRGWTRDMSRKPEGQARETRRSVLDFHNRPPASYQEK